MRRGRRFIGAITGCLAALVVTFAAGPPPVNAFTMETLTVGSRGYNVDELQARLGFLGYYHGKIDGDFGWDTYWAVRDFQYNFMGRATGIVDLKTRQKLVAATKGWHYRPAGASGSSSSSANQSASSGGSSAAGSAAAADALPSTAGGLSQSDLSLMAHVVYAEARGEPFEGQVAVAAVILNRLKDPSKFPHTVAGIIYQPLAFTSVQDGQINLTPNAQAKEAVMDAVEGWDPSHGATYYFDPATATSPWIWSKPEIVTIGHHIFCSS